MHYFILLLVSSFLDTASASMQYQNYALSNCLHQSSKLSDKLTHYIYLTKNSQSQHHINECEDAIVADIFENFQEEEYLEKLSMVNESAKTYPVDMCILDIAIRSEWERRYLPLLSTEYFKEYRANNSGSNMYTSLMTLLIFRDINSTRRIAKIGHLLFRLAMMGYITKEAVTNRDLLLLKKNRFSSPDIPVDPALVLDCPAIGSLQGGLEATNIHALGEMLEREVVAGLTSMGFNLGAFGAMRMIQRAKAIKNISTTTKVVRGGLSIGAVLGPQVLVFGGSMVAYEGVEAGVKHYLNKAKRNNFESELKGQIGELDQSVRNLRSSLSKMPDHFYSLNLNTHPELHEKIGKVEGELKRTYILGREIMEDVYNLIGFYNVPILEKSMELNGKLQDIQTFKDGWRDISWIESAHNKIRADLSIKDDNYTTYRKFQTQTNSTNIDAGKVIRAYLKWQEATDTFENDVTQIRMQQSRCMPEQAQGSYRHDIYRISLIEMLKNQKLDAVNNLYRSLDLQNLELMDEVNRLATTLATRNYTPNGEILNSIYNNIDRAIVLAMPVYKGLDFQNIQNRHSNRVINHLRLTMLERDIKQSNRAWYDSFRQGNFCRDSSSLLYQASQYFAYLHLVMIHLYKNKMRVGFFDNFSKRIHAEINRNESFEVEMRNKMTEGFKTILKQRDKRPHGGAL